MNFNEMKIAVEDAERTKRAFEAYVDGLASLLCGNLRSVNRRKDWKSCETLRELKKELTKFNSKTGEWK